MAIATLPTTTSTVQVVYTDDPDVTPRNGSRGWILRSEATLAAGADLVELRPLNADERAEAADVDGAHRTMLSRVRMALVSVNGHTDAKHRESFIRACPGTPLFLLGLYVGAITAGQDPQPAQRRLLAGDDDEDAAPDEE